MFGEFKVLENINACLEVSVWALNNSVSALDEERMPSLSKHL
jgi:hypothetical protein